MSLKFTRRPHCIQAMDVAADVRVRGSHSRRRHRALALVVQQDAAGIGDQQRADSALARCIRVVAAWLGNKGLEELPGEPPERHMTRLGANPFGRGLFGGNGAADIHEEGHHPEFGIPITETVRPLLDPPICFGMPLSRV
jgi:hypothetical protein